MRAHAHSRAFAVALSLGAIAAVGCRGVIGIEDVTLVDGGALADGAADGSSQGDALPPSDSGSGDTAADAPPSTCGATSTTRQACTQCCGQETPLGAGQYFGLADQGNTCACQACTGPCTSYRVCGGGTPLAGMTTCGGCVVSQEIDSRCPDLAQKCDNDAQCKKFGACVRTCAPLPP